MSHAAHPDDLHVPLPEHLTVAERVALWVDLMDAADALLWAGLRREHANEEAARAAYRAWHERRNDEHHAAAEHLFREIVRRSQPHAGT